MKIKSAKKFGKKFHYKWSTHQPVISTMMEILKPELIIELGTGRYSSPGLISSTSALKTIHIDNDAEWIRLIQEENSHLITEKNEFRVHDVLSLGITSLKTLPSMLTLEQKTFIDQYHNNLAEEIKKMNFKSSMIFTDGFAACRKSSVDLLTGVSDSLIFHDAEKYQAQRDLDVPKIETKPDTDMAEKNIQQTITVSEYDEIIQRLIEVEKQVSRLLQMEEKLEARLDLLTEQTKEVIDST